MLNNHDVTAILIRPNPKLLSIKSYYSYKDEFVKRIYLPYKARGRKITSVGVFDHIMYTLFSVAMLPKALGSDVVIFITPSYFHTIIIPILKLFRKKVYTVVLDPQEVLKRGAETSFFKKIYYELASCLERMTIKKSDKVFAVSTYLLNEYKKLNKNVFYVPNGADNMYIKKIKAKKASRQFTIAYFGSLDPWRGVKNLVSAFQKIEKTHDVKLVLLGGGAQEEEIRKMARNSKNIYVSGFIKHQDAIAICKGADLLVIPFMDSPILYKTMPIKTFEYIACGVPIVVTDTGEHANIIKRFGSGIAVSPTEAGIADGLSKILRDKKLYRKLKKNAEKASDEVDFRRTRKPFFDAFN